LVFRSRNGIKSAILLDSDGVTQPSMAKSALGKTVFNSGKMFPSSDDSVKQIQLGAQGSKG